jgi:hypothetical protein
MDGFEEETRRERAQDRRRFRHTGRVFRMPGVALHNLDDTAQGIERAGDGFLSSCLPVAPATPESFPCTGHRICV